MYVSILLSTTVFATVIDTQVSTGSDDAYHAPAGWPGYSDSKGYVYAGAPSNAVWGGWRWTGFNIPAVDLNIGHRNAWNSYIDGKIDEVQLYNRALSPSEVQQLFTG